MRAGTLALALVSLPLSAQQAAPAAPTTIARIAYVEDVVELRRGGGGWSRVAEGAQLRIGDGLRTGPRGAARIDFAWMSVAVAGSSQLAVPPSRVLATVLEEGRVEQFSPSGDMIKLLTAEAAIRGSGRVAVRREGGRTLVSALEGTFRVEAAKTTVVLAAGNGTVVAGSGPPLPSRPLPRAPSSLDPGDDPLYVSPDEPISLRFESNAKAHHVQILAIDENAVLIERDFAGAPATIAIPWLGTFRWRVAARDADGLEGPVSKEGLIAVVSK